MVNNDNVLVKVYCLQVTHQHIYILGSDGCKPRAGCQNIKTNTPKKPKTQCVKSTVAFSMAYTSAGKCINQRAIERLAGAAIIFLIR